MVFVPTAEDKARYRENRRLKYRENPEYRASQLRNNKTSRERNLEEIKRRRKEKWRSDPEFRERQLASRRGKSQRHVQLKAFYGLSLAEYKEMEASQGFVCAICSQPAESTLCVDHCHVSLKVRGLLCRKCNTGLGCFRDDPELMIKAMAYLEGKS